VRDALRAGEAKLASTALRAKRRSAAEPSSAPTKAYSSQRVVENSAGSSASIVQSTPAASKAAIGWLPHCHGAGQVVGGRTEFERHAALGQVRYERRVGEGPHSVPDAFRAEYVERLADALRTGGLAGVCHAVQPHRAGELIRLAIQRRG